MELLLSRDKDSKPQPVKRFLISSIVLFLFKLSVIQAQDYDVIKNYYPLYGLEIINPYYNNPAFIVTENDIQIDLLGYGLNMNQGFMANTLLNLPKSFGYVWVNYEQERYEDSKSWGLNVGYARSFRLSTHTSLNAGISYKPYRIMDRVNDMTGNPYCEIEASILSVGVSLEIKRLTIGLSTVAPMKSAMTTRFDDTDHEYADLHEVSGNVVYLTGGYQAINSDKFTLEPIVGVDFHYLNRDESKIKYYIGTNSSLGKTFGVGFTIGSINSLNGSVNIGRSIKLYLLMYSGIPQNEFNYYLGKSDWNIIGQLRVNLHSPKRIN